MSLDYGKVTTSETYYDGVITNTRKEVEISIMSTRDELLKDLIDSLEVISSGETHKLTLEINVDSKGKYRIVRKWAI